MVFTRRETAILAIGDFLILAASLWAALLIRNLALPGWGYFAQNLVPFIPVFLLSIAVFYIAGLYEKQTRLVRRVMGERIAYAQVANVIIAALLFFVLPLTIAPKTILAIYLVVSVIAVTVWRFFRVKRELAKDSWTEAVLIARGDAARELFEEANENGRSLVHFGAIIDPSESSAKAIPAALEVARDKGARLVVLDTRDPVVVKALPELYGAMLEGVVFAEFENFYEGVFDRVPLEHVDHAWLLERLPRSHSAYQVAKRAFDILLAIVGLIIAIPFVLVAAILLSFSGAPFIRNERVGKNERTFTLYKLRTMLLNDRGDPELRAKNRVTALGSFLRKTRIDELPQLWNILIGDLSFIGPRPELPSIAAIYEKEIPYYRARHLIAPGLSGWAQIRDYDAPKGGADVERTKTKLSYDLFYLKHRSFGLDLSIAAKTLRALASFSGK